MTRERTIKVIVFPGKKEDFTDYWEDKLLARTSRRGFQELLTGLNQKNYLRIPQYWTLHKLMKRIKLELKKKIDIIN